MSKQKRRNQPPLETRFKKGQSGNPGGRPKKIAAAQSVFAVLERTLITRRDGKMREFSVDEALQHKTWQKAMAGERRGQREVLRMIIEREKALVKLRPQRTNRIRVEHFNPKNAFEALRLLDLATDINVGKPNHALALQLWAVQAALNRRALSSLTPQEIAGIKESTHDAEKLKWPKRFQYDY
jgi:hypothetical protein